MYAIDLFLKEHDSNRNQLGKLSGISTNTLSNVVLRKTPIQKVDSGLLKSLSDLSKVSMDEVYTRLIELEENE